MAAILEISDKEKLYKKYPELHRNVLELVFTEYKRGKIHHKNDIEEVIYQCLIAVVDVLYK